MRVKDVRALRAAIVATEPFGSRNRRISRRFTRTILGIQDVFTAAFGNTPPQKKFEEIEIPELDAVVETEVELHLQKVRREVMEIEFTDHLRAALEGSNPKIKAI